MDASKLEIEQHVIGKDPIGFYRVSAYSATLLIKSPYWATRTYRGMKQVLTTFIHWHVWINVSEDTLIDTP